MARPLLAPRAPLWMAFGSGGDEVGRLKFREIPITAVSTCTGRTDGAGVEVRVLERPVRCGGGACIYTRQ